MSLYADYMSEVYGKNVIENESSIVVWTMKDDIFYLEDIYIKPDLRDQGLGKKFMELIVQIAKNNGCTKLLGSITLLNKYRDENMMKFLKYGFSLHSLSDNIIYMIKDI